MIYDKGKMLRIFEVYKNKISTYGELEIITKLYFDNFHINKDNIIFYY